jgi:hypothetical protein
MIDSEALRTGQENTIWVVKLDFAIETELGVARFVGVQARYRGVRLGPLDGKSATVNVYLLSVASNSYKAVKSVAIALLARQRPAPQSG